ncbi:hypothetical protein GQX74_015521 [Glossina fuscipes]|nr:hypothetical protein GQX74_015521 [Glossina fuscipes]
MSTITRIGKKGWDRSVIWGMLKNPAYKGQAAFGKTKIYVKVPNIVDEDVFDIVQEQLADNRKIARTRGRGAKHLLQALIVCRDSYRFGGNKFYDNKHIRTDALETAVWEEVKHLLKSANRVLEEYRRRLSELKKSSWNQKSDLLDKQENKLKRGIATLIDSYAQEYINQEECEPRIKAMKQSLKTIEEGKKRIFDQKKPLRIY